MIAVVWLIAVNYAGQDWWGRAFVERWNEGTP
jgi:hypothetical protein